MSYTMPAIVHLPACPIVGLSIVTTLQRSREQGTVRQLYTTMIARSAEVEGRVGTALFMVQIYPMQRRFNFKVPYTVLVGAQVESLERIPSGMIGHTIPAGDYAGLAHIGPEIELSATYRYIYGSGLRELGRQPAWHDVEVLDERYMPDNALNTIDIYVALRQRRFYRNAYVSNEVNG